MHEIRDAIRSAAEYFLVQPKEFFRRRPRAVIAQDLDLSGPWLIRLLSPERSARVPAPAVFRPTESLVDPQIVRTFVATQQELVRIMAGTAPRDLDRIVTSPAARFMTYRLLDAYRIIVVHGQLHLQQARRLTEQAGFPRTAATA